LSLVYGDTSFWIAYLMPDERKHAEAERYVASAKESGVTFVLTNLVILEAVKAVRKKLALAPNNSQKQRIKTANELAPWNDPAELRQQSYMKRVETESQQKIQELIEEITKDTKHFAFEMPDEENRLDKLSAFELFKQSRDILQGQTTGRTRPVFPTRKFPPRLCFGCMQEINSPFLGYNAVGAEDISHLLLAAHNACKVLVTMDKGFHELRPWAANIIQIEVL
jgi:predicted nucleic acid-binding protein